MNGGEPMPQLADSEDSGSATATEKPTLEALFEDEEGPLLGFAWKFVGRREVAEEMVQEGFIRLHTHWNEVENPRAWIYRAVRNLCLSHLRKHKRESVSDVVGECASDGKPIPDEALGRLEAVAMVRLHLAEMNPDDRELIRLKYHDDLRYADIGRRTGLSTGNVGYRLHHLLKDLAASLRKSGISGSTG